MSDKLSTNQWAVICAIRTEPHYKFVGSERVSAQRMVDSGLLRWNRQLPYECHVTDKGWKLYAKGVKP